MQGPPPGPSYLLAAGEQSLQSGQLLSFPLDTQTGALGTPLAIAGPQPPIFSMTVAGEKSPFLYVAPVVSLQSFPDQIHGYAIDAKTGALSEIASSPFAAADAITLSGGSGFNSFLYVGATSALSGGLAPAVNAFSIGTDGSLSPSIAGSPFTAGPLTNIMAGPGPILSNQAPYLYATEYEGSTGAAGGVAAFTVDPNTGVLMPVPGSPFSTGPNGSPVNLVYDSRGFVYVTLFNTQIQNAQHYIAGFSVNPGTGALTPVPGSPFPASSVASLTLDASGLYLFTGMDDTMTTVEFQIDAASGVLTPMTGIKARVYGPFLAYGNFLYAATTGTSGIPDSIAGFSINETTGALTPLAGSPFLAGSAVTAMASVTMPGQ
ncbi:MAG TPA: hypothetical protein VE377_27565 [Candidatus Dormibacteraeota bacterium]|nr:hypothetical protein [Candidatus Dormibacteraeota bacterium]